MVEKMLYSKKKISIIVPAYNAERYLNRCLDSIINQSFVNIEIIVVNDGSTDRTKEIIANYVEKEKRIIYIEHEKNRGLFQARLSGVEVATGDYVAFVDADDYITIDFYRTMLRNSDDADIVVGNTILEDENNWLYVTNMTKNFGEIYIELKNDQIFNCLMENEGLIYSWHTIWNKIYKVSLWKKCLPYYHRINTHIVMTEDILFSIVLFFYAENLKFVDADGYIYFRHSNASTGKNTNEIKLMKDIKDLSVTFNFMESFLREKKLYLKYEQKYYAWKKRYFRWWSNTVLQINNLNIEKYFLEVFKEDKLGFGIAEDNYFDEGRTGWQQSYEILKKKIIDENLEYISFDIFDTLIVRPFLEPSDLFLLMQKEFVEWTDSSLQFVNIRKQSESICRRNLCSENSFYEDVTLKEIYFTMQEEYGIPHSVCSQLMCKENELEIEFSLQRKSVMELYELALYMGKKIIILSDMYLEKNVIEKILNKNGYYDYSALYVSSDVRKLKYTKNLFVHAMKELKVKDYSTVLHIGDNVMADIVPAKELGISTFHIPKAKDVLLNETGYKKGKDINPYFEQTKEIIKAPSLSENLQLRCMLALVANRFFDNPFVSFNEYSDYNLDSYYIGYHPLGFQMFSFVKWMLEDAIKRGYKKIHFIARDGYLPKMIYDILARAYSDAPEAGYLYASRKSLIPTTIKTPRDLYCLQNYMEVMNKTPIQILDMLKAILKPKTEDIIKKYKDKGILVDIPICTAEKFKRFIDVLIECSYDQSIVDNYQEKVSRYFNSIIDENECTFDLGYSGKIQKMLCDITGKKIDVYFLHTSGSEAKKIAKESNFEIHSYYAFIPSISGIVREYMISEYGPSCIGYDGQNEMQPVFEETTVTYQEKILLDKMHRGTKDLIENFVDIFSSYKVVFNDSSFDLIQPFEFFLRNINEIDKKIFLVSSVEDDVHAGKNNLNLLDIWDYYLNKYVKTTTYTMVNQSIQNPYNESLYMELIERFNRKFPVGTKRRSRIKKIILFLFKRS